MKKLTRAFALLLAALCLLTAAVGCSKQEVADAVVSIAADAASQAIDEALAGNSDESQAAEETQAPAGSTAAQPTAAPASSEAAATPEPTAEPQAAVTYGEACYSTDDVALYLHLYGELPPNYLTKSEAEALGWQSNKGNLWDVTDKGCIGGDRFGNREGNLPKEKGLSYTECDVNYEGGYRGSDRLIFDNKGNIYFTGDHYSTFTLLYTSEGAAS